MKISIPDALKSDIPANLWGKVFAATPIVMTVIATMLAGLSTSEMTRAQYDRSMAAQLQSKAGDQWAYFQAKRMRETIHRDTLVVLKAGTDIGPLGDASFLRTLAPVSWAGSAAWTHALDGLLSSPAGSAGLASLRGKAPASGIPMPSLSPRIRDVLVAVERSESELKIAKLLASVGAPEIDKALDQARERVRSSDAAGKPVSSAIDRLGELLDQLPPGDAERMARRDFEAARLRYLANHYVVEAADNQRIALLLELQVRKGNLSAERHHSRSQQFFMGMLAAQLGVIVATFAMAAKQKSILWGIAAAAGVIALALSAYVYLYV